MAKAGQVSVLLKAALVDGHDVLKPGSPTQSWTGGRPVGVRSDVSCTLPPR